MYSSTVIILGFGPFFSSSVIIWEPGGCSHVVCCSLTTFYKKNAVCGQAGSSAGVWVLWEMFLWGCDSPRRASGLNPQLGQGFLGVSRRRAMSCWKLMLAASRRHMWKATPSGLSRKSPPAPGLGWVLLGCWVHTQPGGAGRGWPCLCCLHWHRWAPQGFAACHAPRGCLGTCVHNPNDVVSSRAHLEEGLAPRL